VSLSYPPLLTAPMFPRKLPFQSFFYVVVRAIQDVFFFIELRTLRLPIRRSFILSRQAFPGVLSQNAPSYPYGCFNWAFGSSFLPRLVCPSLTFSHFSRAGTADALRRTFLLILSILISCLVKSGLLVIIVSFDFTQHVDYFTSLGGASSFPLGFVELQEALLTFIRDNALAFCAGGATGFSDWRWYSSDQKMSLESLSFLEPPSFFSPHLIFYVVSTFLLSVFRSIGLPACIRSF